MKARHRRLLTLLGAATFLAASANGIQAQAAAGAPAEVTRAQGMLQRNQPDSAIVLLEDFFRRVPGAFPGRVLLGNAYRQKGDLDRALVAYDAVNQPPAARAQARYASAQIQAQRGRVDDVVRLLAGLKAGGNFDMDIAKSAAEFAAFRNDARFQAAMFKREEFHPPFVEPVRILHEWVGETRGDQFSWIARGIGDVDGDRASDIVTSAPTYGANGQPTGPGRVYLYSGRSGKLLWSRTGSERENLGTGLEGAGDVNRDGVNDVIAGAPGSRRAYVFSGRDGAVLLTLRSSEENDSFGQSASGAGDVNGDGHADLIVGAPASNAAAAGAGRAYVFSGRDGATLLVLAGEAANDAFGSIVSGPRASSNFIVIGAPGAGARNTGRVYVHQGLQPAPRFVIDADETGGALGAMFASVVGDVDGDRVPDISATDFGNSAKGPATGRLYIYSGATGKPLHKLTGETAGDGFGIGAIDWGDVNGDGFADLVVGAWQYAGAAQSGGRVYIHSGKDGSVLRTITCRIPGDTFGFDAASVGDVNGDGKVDLLLTSSWSHINGFRAGRMFLIAGE